MSWLKNLKAGPDLAHQARIAAVLDVLPAGTDLPAAMLVLEDAYLCCKAARELGVSFERVREIHREEYGLRP